MADEVLATEMTEGEPVGTPFRDEDLALSFSVSRA